jgi:hypothetical protein
MNKLALTGVLLLALIACNNDDKKKEAPKEEFFPVIGFINSQVKHVDTSLYSIRKVTYVDSIHTDTAYIRREDFEAEARDFLSLPDIFKAEYADRYTETKGFDGTINRGFLLYTPVNPEREIIKDMKVLIRPDPSGDRPSTIIINTGISTKDSIVEKNLLWLVDKSFLVTTTRQVAGQPEQTTTYKVIWNEDENE